MELYQEIANSQDKLATSNDDASKLDERQKVLGMLLVACHDPPEVLQPREEPFIFQQLQ